MSPVRIPLRVGFALRTLFAALLLVCSASGQIIKEQPQKPPSAKNEPVAAGAVRANPKEGLKYVWIPPGSFQMGCSPGDNECHDNEKPAHQVSITKGFWMGQTDVTVGAYKRFAGATGRQMPGAPNFNNGWTNENMPIVNVTWNDAHDYCEWAGGRLPSEAEWEYAARGGSTEARYGDLDEIAWYEKNSGGGARDVAQKRANGFGLYDVLGNVWQWVNDWYDGHYYQSSPSEDPQGPSSGSARVLRGGSWIYVPSYVRVSYRVGLVAGASVNLIGFRCVGGVEQPPSAPQVETPRQGALTAGTVKVNPKDGLKYVWIPPGSFQMGCSPGDNDCFDYEKPAHQVGITKGFWMGQTDVTVGAYKRFAGATGRWMPWAPNFNNGWTNENMPIVNVSWNDAHDYCEWAGGRLPSEAEWEYAARGGSTEARYGPIGEIAWYADNSGLQRLDSTRIWSKDRKNYAQRLKDNRNGAHEVGLKRPNGSGLYDVLGNVLQWVSDWYDGHYYQGSPSQDPSGPTGGEYRVLRGGSWFSVPRDVRVSVRSGSVPGGRDGDSGFRCVEQVANP